MQITKLSNKYTSQTLKVNYNRRGEKVHLPFVDKYKKPIRPSNTTGQYFTGKSQRFFRFIDHFAPNFVIDIKLYCNLIRNKDPKCYKMQALANNMDGMDLELEMELVFVHV